MATATNIREESYIFKSNTTYLSQTNWQNFFINSLPAGFYDHYGYYDASADKYKLSIFKGILFGLQFSSDQNEEFQPTTGDALYYLKYDYLAGKFHLAQLTGIGSTAAESINFLTQMMVRYSRSLKDLGSYLSSYVGSSYVLPVAYYVSGHGYWDLLKIIPPNGESYPVVAYDTGDTAVETPYAGLYGQHGLSQIYGKHTYSITLQSGYEVGEYHLYPVPAISTDPSKIYITNGTSSTVTIKLPLSYRDMYFEYLTDNTWTEDSGFLTYDLAGGSSMILTMQQFSCQSYTSGGVNYPKTVYEINRGFENVDIGDVYSKAEANALFETKTDAETALATKADASEVAGKADADDVYTKTAADALLAEKADADDVYTKSQVDAMIEEIPVTGTVYTKTETNALLAEKADASDVYEKTQVYTKTETNALLAEKADANSPTLTGQPKAPTAASGTNSTQIATTAFVQNAVSGKADLYSPTFTGQPKASTAASGTNTTQLATTAFVQREIKNNGAGKTVYVNASTGNDSTGDGSQSAPFKTIQKGIDALPSGGDFSTLYVSPDTYNEAVTISAKNVIIRSTAGAGSVIYTRCTSGVGDYAYKITNGSNVQFYGGFTVWSNGGTITVEKGSYLRYQAYDSTVDKLRVISYNSTSGLSNNFIMSVTSGSTFVAGYGQPVQTSWEGTRAQNEYGIYADEGAYVSIMNLTVGDGSGGVNAAFRNRASITICGTLTGSYVATDETSQGGIASIGTAS